MNSLALGVYALSVVVLFLKFLATITLQAVERLRERRFRYPEDAAFWRGSVGDDSDRCVRAQQLLRNDAESQLWYLGLGASYLWLAAWPTPAPYYFALYAISRVAHAHFLLTGRQPHRNRAFALGLAVVVTLAAHVAYAACRAMLSGA